MTKREGVVITAVTGCLCVPSFGEFHKYVEELMDRPVWTHEMGSKVFAEELKLRAKPEFEKIMEGMK